MKSSLSFAKQNNACVSFWYLLSETELTLSIFVKTNAHKTAIVRADKEHLHISLHAKPKDGEANTELIQFLSKYLHLPKTQILLRRGQQSRYKQVVCRLEKNQRTTKLELSQLLESISKATAPAKKPQ